MGEKTTEFRHTGLSNTWPQMISKYEQFADKPNSYYGAVISEEARRDAVDLMVKDLDRLGITPQAKHLKTDEERSHRRSLDARDADADDNVQDHCCETRRISELLFSAFDERDQRMELERFMEALPEDLHDLCHLWANGVRPTEARQLLGLPASTETALRGRISRYHKKREESA